MTRIERKFEELKTKNKKAFIAFITAGYPDLATTKKLVKELENRGVDIIELGVPFSDPLADGPVIQKASAEALGKGINLPKIFKAVSELRRHVEIPLCLMTYYNPVFRFGEEKFIKSARLSGVDGIILPDLPAEEGKSLLRLANKNNIDVIQFISPTTSNERARFISSLARGFIYYVSLTGVTGVRKNLPADLAKKLKHLRKITSRPICAGFGISAPRHLRAVFQFADGAIVGSAIVKEIERNFGRKDVVKRVGNFVESLL